MRTQQHLSFKIAMPDWLMGDVLDVRLTVMQWLCSQPPPGDTDGTTPVCRVSLLRRNLTPHFIHMTSPLWLLRKFSVSFVTGVSLTLTKL
jgi:hypothetical protein